MNQAATTALVTGCLALLLSACDGGSGRNRTGLPAARIQTPAEAAAVAVQVAAMWNVERPQAASTTSAGPQLRKAGRSSVPSASADETGTRCSESGWRHDTDETRDVDSPFAPDAQFAIGVVTYDNCHDITNNVTLIVDGVLEDGVPVIEPDPAYEIAYARLGFPGATLVYDHTNEHSDSRERHFLKAELRIDSKTPMDYGDPAYEARTYGWSEITREFEDKVQDHLYREHALIQLGRPGEPFLEIWDSSGRLSLQGRIGYATDTPAFRSCGLGEMVVTTLEPLAVTTEAVTGLLRMTAAGHEALVRFNADGSYTVTLDGQVSEVDAGDLPPMFCGEAVF